MLDSEGRNKGRNKSSTSWRQKGNDIAYLFFLPFEVNKEACPAELNLITRRWLLDGFLSSSLEMAHFDLGLSDSYKCRRSGKIADLTLQKTQPPNYSAFYTICEKQAKRRRKEKVAMLVCDGLVPEAQKDTTPQFTRTNPSRTFWTFDVVLSRIIISRSLTHL